MKKNKMEILDELASALDEVRSKVDQLADLVEVLRQSVENEQERQEYDAGLEIPEYIEDITDMDIVAEDIPEVAERLPEAPEILPEVAGELPEVSDEQQFPDDQGVTENQDVIQDSGIQESGALFGEGDLNSEQAGRKSPVFLDVMASRHSWKNDIPGPEVKDVRSAISLNDRVLFINSLFREDPMAFQSALNAINSMAGFSEAENYLMASHPEWNFDSDIVYRFMMAIRRKLR